ncbi:MAG: hypothetical protein RBS14_00910 [Atribacterota bacterium]|jgi:hypothetical protein|nr:hypothetical protein [Atribacterota bacterium]
MRKSQKREISPLAQTSTRENIMDSEMLPQTPYHGPGEPSARAQASADISAPDPFDPAQFAVHATMAGGVGVVKQLVTCPVRKPGRQEFVRVHPDAEYRLSTFILELKEERETYLVYPSVAAELPGEMRIVSLRLAVSRQGAIFLWPVPEPTLDGRENEWWTSARIAAGKAESGWIRMVANMSQGAYDVSVATGVLGEPVWPDKSLGEILKVAFGEKFIIRDGAHPVIRRLLGLS